MEKIKTIIVDDHSLFREGLAFLLEQSPNIKVAGQASNGLEFIELLKEEVPDVVLMDISMPKMNGIDATQRALSIYPDLKIIALSMYDDKEYYYKMIHAGVSGFILKKTNARELFEAIEKVYTGNNYFSTDLLKSVILDIPKKGEPQVNNPVEEFKLTQREMQVLNLLVKGLTTKEIGEQIFLSPKTIEGYKYSLFSKTGAKNSVALVMFAIKNKLVSIS